MLHDKSWSFLFKFGDDCLRYFPNTTDNYVIRGFRINLRLGLVWNGLDLEFGHIEFISIRSFATRVVVHRLVETILGSL